MSPVNRGSFTPSCPIWMVFILFCGLVVLAGTSRAVWGQRGKSGHFLPYSRSRGKALKFSTVVCAIGCGFQMLFIKSRKFPSNPSLLS